MLGYGFWLGLLPLAASALMFWIGYCLQHSAAQRPGLACRPQSI
jgi:hypothetical protein